MVGVLPTPQMVKAHLGLGRLQRPHTLFAGVYLYSSYG